MLDYIQTLMLWLFGSMLVVMFSAVMWTVLAALGSNAKHYYRQLRNSELDWLKRRWHKGRPLVLPPYRSALLFKTHRTGAIKEGLSYDAVVSRFAAVRSRWAGQSAVGTG